MKPSPPSPPNETWRRIGELLANVTVITGLLVFFGWKRSDTQAHELGIDSNILGMSTKDYVLRSVGSVFTLLAFVVLVALAWLWLDPRLRAIKRTARFRLVTFTATFSWLGLPLIVVGIGYVWPISSFYLFPLSVGGGILLSLYALHLRGTQRWNWARIKLFASGAVVLSLFWSAMNLAIVEGIELADRFAGDVRSAVGVVVYSKDRLHLAAPEVWEEALPPENSAYRYRYGGLRLLENTGGKYFLASDGWTRERGVVVVLRDDTATRLEFVRG
jgi:hypothetical protein